MTESDHLYAKSQTHIVDFAFDEAVTAVFPDMIRRSVPGYEAMLSLIAIASEAHVQPGSNVYDLGCSLGATTLAIRSRLGHEDMAYIAVDSSPSMIDACRENLARHIPSTQYQCLCQDVRETVIENAGIIAMNFTLQFLPRSDRGELIDKIYNGLNPGAIFILSEKIGGVDEAEDARLVNLHHQFKIANGYSDMEISQKRSALENVMKLDRAQIHLNRLHKAGFSNVTCIFQCLNFMGWVAVK